MKGWSHADLMMMYVVVVWGSAFTVIKLITADVSIEAANAVRFLLIIPSFPREMLAVAVLGLVGFGAYQLLSSYGISLSIVAGSALILATTPIFTALFSGLFRVERIEPLAWLGVAIGFVGIAVIIVGEHGPQALRVDSAVGELALIASAACWAAGAVISKPLMRKHSSIKITAYSSVVGAAIYLPFILPSLGSIGPGGIGPATFALILYWVLAGNIIGQLVRFHSVKWIGPQRATLYLYLVPFSAALIGALVIGSPVGVHHFIGGAVIFVGIALTRLRRRVRGVRSPISPP